MMASSSPRMSLASSRAIAFVLSSIWPAGSGTAMSLPRLPRRRCLTAGTEGACFRGELPASVVEAGIPVAARLEAEAPGGLGNVPAVPLGTVISGRVYPSGQFALIAADPHRDPRGDASPGADGGLGHGSSSFSGSRDHARLTCSARLSLWIVAPVFVACLAWQRQIPV